MQFFISAEKFRRHGPTTNQIILEQKTGIDFTFRLQLHKSLKKLLREVVITKDKGIQNRYLTKVYAWYYQKLELMGQMSAADKEESDLLLNPGMIEEAMKRREEIKL